MKSPGVFRLLKLIDLKEKVFGEFPSLSVEKYWFSKWTFCLILSPGNFWRHRIQVIIEIFFKLTSIIIVKNQTFSISGCWSWLVCQKLPCILAAHRARWCHVLRSSAFQLQVRMVSLPNYNYLVTFWLNFWSLNHRTVGSNPGSGARALTRHLTMLSINTKRLLFVRVKIVGVKLATSTGI